MKNSRVLLAFILLVMLAACAKPLPQDRQDYAGLWRNGHVALYISLDGRVRYLKQENHTRTSINAPIKEFVGDSFEVGVGPLYTTFKVTKRPYQDGGTWKMEVDGQVLRKSGSNSNVEI